MKFPSSDLSFTNQVGYNYHLFKLKTQLTHVVKTPISLTKTGELRRSISTYEKYLIEKENNHSYLSNQNKTPITHTFLTYVYFERRLLPRLGFTLQCKLINVAVVNRMADGERVRVEHFNAGERGDFLCK